MCLIIKTNGEKIPLSHMKRGFNRNPHSAGYSVYIDGKIITNKGFNSFEEFYDSYKNFDNVPGIIHFRYSTCGIGGKFNSHPFIVGRGKNKVSFVHNGHINIQRYGNNSDTKQFAETYLENFIEQYPFDSKILAYRIKQIVGDDGKNKLVLMSSQGKFMIIGEEFGIWNNNIWYSNGDYKLIANLKRTWRKSQIRFTIKNFLYKLIDNL